MSHSVSVSKLGAGLDARSVGLLDLWMPLWVGLTLAALDALLGRSRGVRAEWPVGNVCRKCHYALSTRGRAGVTASITLKYEAMRNRGPRRVLSIAEG